MFDARLGSTVDLVERCRHEAPWLAIALKERGQKEVSGHEENNPRIVEYIQSFP